MPIEIAISTLNDGIFNIKLRHDFNYLIVHQITNNKDYSFYINSILNKNVRYISSNEIGLSKSRNIAIKNTHSDYIWIMDDDVTILDDAQEKINSLISENQNCDMFILNHKPVKKNKTSYINEYSAMSVSSIDMLIKRNSIINNNISFNENFGLGTSLPSGEEYIFTIEMLRKKLTIIKTKDIFSFHPDILSGNDFYSSNNKLRAKLEMFSFWYGAKIGRLIYIAFVLKKMKPLIKNKRFFSALFI